MKANRRGKLVHITENDRAATESPPGDLDAGWVEILLGNPAHVYIQRALYDMDHLGFDVNDPDIKARILECGQRDYEADAPRVARQSHHAVVYYMRLGDLVKIGFTTNLNSRRAALNPETVLAIEVGGKPVEQQRHRQFAQHHVHGEWFRLTGDLADHVDRLRSEVEQATGVPFDEWINCA